MEGRGGGFGRDGGGIYASYGYDQSLFTGLACMALATMLSNPQRLQDMANVNLLSECNTS